MRIPIQLNPFSDSAMGTPWSAVPADVASIHEGPFRAVLAELTQMRMGARGSSVVITGEPGSGKTHLLGRLRSRLEEDARAGLGEAIYIYVRCNASAATLWRHVRTTLAASLLKRVEAGPSRLQRLLREHPERLEAVESYTLGRVLAAYGEARHPHAAAGWLRGEALPDADLAALGVGVERDDEDRSREMEAMDVVKGLLAFLAPDVVVLCFDQVEALETYRGDEGFNTMGKLISELSDGYRHLLLVSCIVSAFEDRFDQIPNGADRDRWLKSKLSLRPIEWKQAAELIRLRLDSSPALAEQRKEWPDNPLWPLDAATLKPLFQPDGVCLPRTLIQSCRVQFESLFGEDRAGLPKLSVDECLEQIFEKQLDEARGVVEKQGGDKVLEESLPWLLQSSGNALMKQGRVGNLAFGKAGRQMAVVFCLGGNNNRLTGKLKKADQGWKAMDGELRVIRDASFRLGAKGEEVLNGLKQRGAREVHVLPEALAALQAIHNMITSARSGDLTQDGVGVSEAAVTEWALGHLPPQVEQLRDSLSGGRAAMPDPVLARLAELLRKRKVLAVEVAAAELQLSPEEVSACARHHPMRFGLLAGPPLVLFEAVEGPAPDASGG